MIFASYRFICFDGRFKLFLFNLNLYFLLLILGLCEFLLNVIINLLDPVATCNEDASLFTAKT